MSKSQTKAPAAQAAADVHARISQILDGVTIPPNRLCSQGDSFDTLQNVNHLMSFLAAIDNAHMSGEFEIPDPYMMITLREMAQDAVRYAAEVNDLQLTLRTHAEIGGLEKFIETFKLDKPAHAVIWRPGTLAAQGEVANV
jgi:hypothetical protein